MPIQSALNKPVIDIDLKAAIDRVNTTKIALDAVENQLKNAKNWKGRFVKFIKHITHTDPKNAPNSSSKVMKQVQDEYKKAKQALDQLLNSSRSISFDQLPRLNFTPHRLQNSIMEISLEQMTSPRMRFTDDTGLPGMAYIGYKDGYPAVYALFEKNKLDGWSILTCIPPQKEQDPEPEKEPEYPPGFFDDLSVKPGTLVL